MSNVRQLATRLSRKRSLREIAAIAWLILIAAAFLTPALLHGTSLGPYDLLSHSGLTGNVHTVVHNSLDSDEIQVFIPWQTFAWTQVHAGHLPLWNPDTLLGLPLAFNLQSAPFSLSVAIGYLFPLALAHTATVATRLIIAGIGAYVLARVMRLQIVPALVCATIFELCGAFTIWLGAYEADCMAWAGWIFAASILVLHGRRRGMAVGFLSVTLFLAYLAGEPQIMAVLIATIAIFAIVMCSLLWKSGQHRAAWIALVDHAIAIVAGTALASPLYLPGIQLGLNSARSTGPPVSGLPLYDLTHLLFSNYNGAPTSLSSVIGPDNLYVSMLYVGTIDVILAVVALALYRQHPEILGTAVVAVVLIIVLFASPVVSVFRHIAILDVFRLQLATTSLDLCFAILAGFGAQALLRHHDQRNVRYLFAWTTAAVGLCLLILGMFLVINRDRLDTVEQNIRAGSFFWPTIGCLACHLIVVIRRNGLTTKLRHVAVVNNPEKRRLLEVLMLLVVETGFLLSAGAGYISSSSTFFPTTTVISRFQHLVGTSLVGFGSCNENAFPTTGIIPDVNLAYGIDELAAYDPIFPKSYFTSYGEAAGISTQPLLPVGLFCPAITSVKLARLYGVAYILEPPGSAGPKGTRLDGVLDGEGLYAVPDSGRATLSAPDSKGPVVVTPASQPNPNSWKIQVSASHPSILKMRITAVPGWHANIDGRPLSLHTYDSSMLEAKLPAGNYSITMNYWPTTLTIGLLLAAGTFLGLLGAFVASWRKQSCNRIPD